MAHLSQCGMSVLMKVKLRTTENERACASNCALTSTSLSLHKSGPNGLFQTSSWLKHLDFLKVKVPDTVSHIHSTDSHCIERRISCLLQNVIKQKDSFCLSDQRVVCVNSLIPFVRSRCARSQDNVSV